MNFDRVVTLQDHIPLVLVIDQMIALELNELLDGAERMWRAHEAKETAQIACGNRVADVRRMLSAAEMRLDVALAKGGTDRAKIADKICALTQKINASGAAEYQFRLMTAGKVRDLVHLMVAHEDELAQGIEAARAEIIQLREQLETAHADLEKANADVRISADAIRILEQQIAHVCATRAAE